MRKGEKPRNRGSGRARASEAREAGLRFSTRNTQLFAVELVEGNLFHERTGPEKSRTARDNGAQIRPRTLRGFGKRPVEASVEPD